MHQVLTVNLLSQPKVFMSYRIKFSLLGILAYFVAVFPTSAQKQLQDNFVLDRQWSNTFTLVNQAPGYGITVDASNRCYVANGSGIYVYNSTGSLVTNWPVSSARDVFFDPVSNVVFVCSATGNNQVRVYDLSFNLVNLWGTNSLNSPYGLSIGTDGLVYIVDSGNNQVQVFDRKGNFQRKWGSTGSLGGQFTNPYDIAIGPDGSVYVADTGNGRLQQFDVLGDLLSTYTETANWTVKAVAVSPDGLIYAWGGTSSAYGARLFPAQLANMFGFPFGHSEFVEGAAYDRSGNNIYILTQTQIHVYRRIYRTAGLKSPNVLPLPVVLNTAQRSGTQWIDIDFSVVDGDNATVQVGAIGFVDGRQDLLAAVPMKTFTNGTDIISWTNVTTGVQHHLTWDALTDWFTLYGNIKVNILAKDNRNLLDFHLITIPSNATYASPLSISVSPYGYTDFLGVWTWLIATRDPSVNLVTGSVYAVGNLYGVTNQALLAQTQIASGQTNTLTTSDGRTFLYSMISSNMVSTVYSNMIVRAATTNEVYRAAMGTVHTNLTTITKWPPLVQINGLPVNVNEYGFDTGSITAGGGLPNNAWWVVLAPPGQ